MLNCRPRGGCREKISGDGSCLFNIYCFMIEEQIRQEGVASYHTSPTQTGGTDSGPQSGDWFDSHCKHLASNTSESEVSHKRLFLYHYYICYHKSFQ